MWMKLGMLPRRSSSVCIFTADLVDRKFAHRHGPVLLAATERPHPAVAAVSRDNPAEGLPGQEFHQLGKERFAGVHQSLRGPPWKLALTSNRGHRPLPGNSHNSWRSEPSVVS